MSLSPATLPSFYISISTSNLGAATEFFKALDFEQNTRWIYPQSSAFRLPGASSNVGLLVIEDDLFTNYIRPGSQIVNSHRETQATFSFATDTKEEIDALVNKAAAAGGQADPYSLPDHGADLGVYTRSFADVDGHIWEGTTDLAGQIMWDSTIVREKGGMKAMS